MVHVTILYLRPSANVHWKQWEYFDFSGAFPKCRAFFFQKQDPTNKAEGQIIAVYKLEIQYCRAHRVKWWKKSSEGISDLLLFALKCLSAILPADVCFLFFINSWLHLEHLVKHVQIHLFIAYGRFYLLLISFQFRSGSSPLSQWSFHFLFSH